MRLTILDLAVPSRRCSNAPTSKGFGRRRTCLRKRATSAIGDSGWNGWNNPEQAVLDRGTFALQHQVFKVGTPWNVWNVRLIRIADATAGQVSL
jgi:hypothetical protein